ncbi:hypothetical protein EVAR_21161_1 [Eumeta japonica]|uniref:Uncharacterized protein n=1 Tax=Eumeta variegata TaxID=151549 RepID=A0A4C1UPY8_EUMVA|nr:hypothetical protein EVAR_21161_1 [Eumeta japonica]
MAAPQFCLLCPTAERRRPRLMMNVSLHTVPAFICIFGTVLDFDPAHVLGNLHPSFGFEPGPVINFGPGSDSILIASRSLFQFERNPDKYEGLARGQAGAGHVPTALACYDRSLV